MSIIALACPTCGAPLPRSARWATTCCTFCGATAHKEDRRVEAARFREALAAFRAADGDAITLGGRYWRTLGSLARGEHADVLLAERAEPLGEQAILHLGHPGAGPALDKTWAALSALQASRAQGAEVFTRWLPLPVARGQVGERPTLLLGTASGFVHTLADVRAVHGADLDPRHAVWLWRRMLDLLGFMHASGWAHGGLRPEHVLVHARDHGVRLVGWSRARPLGSGASEVEDLRMAAGCICAVLAVPPDRRMDRRVPGPLAAILVEQLFATHPNSAWQTAQAVGAAAAQIYGPPRYVRLAMPGW